MPKTTVQVPVTPVAGAGAPLTPARRVWRQCIVPEPPCQPKGPSRSKGRFLRLPRADRRRKVTIRVVYRGGEASWWLVEARGESEIFPGVCALEDVMARVFSER